MKFDQIFKIVQDSIMDVLPDIQREEINIEDSLSNLGANSIDRMDIIINSMEGVELKIPLVEFGELKNIKGIVSLLYDKKMKDTLMDE
ncbi:acyl carrier protein [Lachnospiraceae bacterium 54-53]